MKTERKPERVPGLLLVVDDLEDNRILARAYLERIGWQVDDCDGGAAAIEYLKHRIPQAMLVDIRMPQVSGEQVVAHVRNDAGLRHMRLVGYTASCFADELARLKNAGFDDILIKPVLMADMARAFPAPAKPA